MLASTLMTIGRAIEAGNPVKLLLRTVFWLGVIMCYLPTAPAHLSTRHDRVAPCRQAPGPRETVLSRDTLTRTDISIAWRGPTLRRVVCKYHMERSAAK